MQPPLTSPNAIHSFSLALLLLLGSGLSSATTIVLNNIDNPGEGLNDNTAASPAGGNNATTIGAQRIAVFEYAAALVATVVNSSEPIVIEAKFDSLNCDASAATLGLGGPQGFYKNTANAPLANTYYSQAQANSHAGSDVATVADDITVTFNGDIDNNNNCLNNRNWYYGLDGNPPGNDIDFLSTVLHEIVHGLGFITLVNLNTGAKQGGGVCDGLPGGGCDDAYMLNIEDHSLGTMWPQLTDIQRAVSATDDPDLHMTGSQLEANLDDISGGINQGHARLHGPSTLTGSSVDHFSDALDPFELMEHQLVGSSSSLGLATFVLQDMGWSINVNAAPIISGVDDQLMLASQVLQLEFALLDNDDAAASLSFEAISLNEAVIPNSGLVPGGSGRLRTLSVTPTEGTTGLVGITVTALDNSSQGQTVFTVEVTDNLPPEVSIDDPTSGSVFYSAPQAFSGSASDYEDGTIDSAIAWSSSINGGLGSGATVTPSLSDGQHSITVSVTDSGGKAANDVVEVNVDLMGDADGDGLHNALEVSLGTNPEDSDTDGDFASDFIEVNRDGDPFNYTEGFDTDPNNPDTDGDGIKDGADYAPLDPEAGGEQVPLLPLLAYALLALCLVLLARQRLKI